MKKFVIICAIIAVIFGVAWATNTTTQDAGIIQITGLDADWFWNVSTDAGLSYCINITSIEFVPSAANDRMIIHDGGIDGVPIFDSGIVSDTDTRIKYFSGDKCLKPVIDITDCTLGTAASAQVTISYR